MPSSGLRTDSPCVPPGVRNTAYSSPRMESSESGAGNEDTSIIPLHAPLLLLQHPRPLLEVLLAEHPGEPLVAVDDLLLADGGASRIAVRVGLAEHLHVE